VLHVLVPLLATATVANARLTRTQRVAAASEFADRTVDLDRKTVIMRLRAVFTARLRMRARRS
jgi:hypothetical protein